MYLKCNISYGNNISFKKISICSFDSEQKAAFLFCGTIKEEKFFSVTSSNVQINIWINTFLLCCCQHTNSGHCFLKGFAKAT